MNTIPHTDGRRITRLTTLNRSAQDRRHTPVTLDIFGHQGHRRVYNGGNPVNIGFGQIGVEWQA